MNLKTHVKYLIHTISTSKKDVAKILEVILDDLGITLEEWRAAVDNHNGIQLREINPSLELWSLYHLSQKTENLEFDELKNIYDKLNETIDQLMANEEIYNIIIDFKRKKPQLNNEQLTSFFIEIVKLMVEDIINYSLDTLPGDGVSSGYNLHPQIIVMSAEIQRKYQNFADQAKRRLG